MLFAVRTSVRGELHRAALRLALLAGLMWWLAAVGHAQPAAPEAAQGGQPPAETVPGDAVPTAPDLGLNSVAAEDPPAVAPPAGEVVPPTLLEKRSSAPPLELPGGAVFVLRLEIDAEGRVVRADALEASHPELLPAVRGAVLQYRFAPATQAGAPVGVTVLYRHLIPSSTPAPVAVEPKSVAPAIEVTITRPDEGVQLTQSAEAVSVIAVGQGPDAPTDSATLLARQEGIAVRRGGGLGSSARLSMNGLTDEQVRAFIDGVPLSYAGFPLGISTVPAALAERIDVYRGVVPPRLGADALGGAIEFSTAQVPKRDLSASASYEVGSFDTHRLHARAATAPSGSAFRARIDGFVDRSENDYPFQQDVPRRDGRLVEQRVYKRNARYKGQGLLADFSLADLPLADRLALRLHITEFERGVPHNQLATVPYGEVTQGARSLGAQADYQAQLGLAAVDVRAGVTYRGLRLDDSSTCTYNWVGQCVAQTEAGEISTRASRQDIDQPLLYARARSEFALHEGQAVEVSVAPSWVSRSGRDRALEALGQSDALSLERKFLSLVSGLRYRLSLLDDALRLQAFGKHYWATLDAEEFVADGSTRSVDRTMGDLGVGMGLRATLYRDVLSAKVSYEWATRLPSPDELFGDGLFTAQNLGLRPERSHNGNASLLVESGETALGELKSEAGFVVRLVDGMIVRLVGASDALYENVGTARILGVQGRLSWASPRRLLIASANLTYDDLRNTSQEGSFARTRGQRLPNRPYLYGGVSLGTELPRLWADDDLLSLSARADFIERYFFGWEGDATAADKLEVPAQTQLSLALAYAVQLGDRKLSMGIQLQNLLDAQVYDSLGVVLPGRAAYARVAVEL